MNFALLQRIASGETSFGRRDVNDATDGDTFDTLVEDLFELEQGRLITMRPAPIKNKQTRHGRYYRTGVCALTQNGRREIDAWRAAQGDRA
jgi:hypothetical protein